MSYRNITVNGKTYQYALGRTHLKIKNFGLFETKLFGNPLKHNPGIFVVTPRAVARVINGDITPEEFYCKEHDVRTIELIADPYASEIRGRIVHMMHCPRCVDSQAGCI